MNLSKFLGRVVETMAVHLTAGAAAKATENLLEKSEDGIAWVRSKLSTDKTKKTATPKPKPEGDSQKTI